MRNAGELNNTLSPLKSRPGLPSKRRAADVAYDAIESMISTLQLEPGAPVMEAGMALQIQIGRTPVHEALLRMVSMGLIVQQPRRGLLVSNIDLADHLNVILTRGVLKARWPPAQHGGPPPHNVRRPLVLPKKC